ncbi:CBL-interacting protein kinase 4-like [Canna indica]|uniref:CBL-interacting protein kinase 4-like n=1 Tax=Canna indica TaxID=4628 RepID=A0AAQ3KH94_9LILI|nr:CBL-interacting protein kinase 4-like [Canna indica]
MSAPHPIFFFLEHAPGGDLLTCVARCGRLPEHAARRYFQQLVSALHYSHARDVAHCDANLALMYRKIHRRKCIFTLRTKLG